MTCKHGYRLCNQKCEEIDWIEQYRIQAVCNVNIKRKINQQESRRDYKSRRKKVIIEHKEMAIKKIRDIKRKKIYAILNDMGINYVSRTQDKLMKRDESLKKLNENGKKERDIIIKLLDSKCKVCGITDPIYFQIDHVNNDGHIDRKKGQGLVTLRRYMQTPERFQLLCANCNHAKRMNGGKIYKPKKRR
jgi:hypothetical protein